MSMFDGIKRQLRSVIQWENPSPDVLIQQWTTSGDEIKNASKLIVGPGQGCVFVYEGRVEAVIIEPGMTDLKTANIPFWTTIRSFMQSFVSEHKVGIYFFKTTKILNQKWGTTSVIKYEDPKYKFPVGLKAFGNYSFRLADPQSFVVSVSGTTGEYRIENFREVMNARIVQPLCDFLAESKFSYNDIDANREELASGVLAKILSDFTALGFELSDFRIEGTTFDESTMKRINRIADMTAEAQAASAVGLNFAQMQQLEAMREAARNEGGMAGMGMGLGAGVGFGQMMAGAMGQGLGTPQTAVPSAKDDPMVTLQKVKQMFDAGLISPEEFDAKKKEILSKM